MDQLICRLHGGLAAQFVQNRDTQHESLEVVLARLDETDQSDPHTKAMGALVRKAAIQVYAHPAWTAADAFTYAEQECIRRKQEDAHAAAVQSHCRFSGVMAVGLVQRRDVDRAPRGSVLAGYDRALRSPSPNRTRQSLQALDSLPSKSTHIPRRTAEDARTYKGVMLCPSVWRLPC
jgi:hypothetical protein